MARPLRLDPEMGIHHVYTRGTKRWALFHDDNDRRYFMGFLSRVCDRYALDVLAFCLMDNHAHIVLRCPDGHISDALRDLKSMYARSFNQRHRSSGPIFEDRFGSKLVTSYRQLRTLVRYVHRNPYSIDPSMDLGSYRWSSHAMYLSRRVSPAWLDASTAHRLFDEYRIDVERALPHDNVQNHLPTSLPIGRVPDTRPICLIPNEGSLEPASLVDVLTAVAQVAGCALTEVHPRARNGLIGIAVMIAFEDSAFSSSEIAEPFGFKTAGAVQSALRRSRSRLPEDERLQEVLAAARTFLAPE